MTPTINITKKKVAPPQELDREQVRLGQMAMSVREAVEQGFLETYIVNPESGMIDKYTLSEKGMACVQNGSS